MTKEKIDGGAILIARQIIESEIFVWKPDKWLKIWLYILAKVNWKDGKKLKRGQGLFKYENIMDATGATKSSVDHCLRYLKKEQMLATRKATRGMVVTVIKYEDYQDIDRYRSDTKSDLKAIQKRYRSDTISKEGEEREEREEENKGIFPEWIPQEEFEEYRKMRIKIKKPMTDKAVELAIKKLEDLNLDGYDPKEILEQSILNSWQGLFPLKQEERNTKKPYNPEAWVKKGD